MSKICCLGDANVCPKSSSCSMVLRSACSHGHSRESSTVKEHMRASPSSRKKHKISSSKKVSCNGNLHLESLESSLNQFALKSGNSTLRGPFSNSFELSEAASQKVIEASSINVSCIKELHFSQLSASSNSLIFENINHEKCSSDYSSASEKDLNSSESLDCNSNMAKSQRYTRSSITSTRSLSGSEDESDISIHRIVRPRLISNDLSTYSTSRRIVLSEQETNSQYVSNNHASYNERLHARYAGNSHSDSLSHFSESSHSSRMTVENSLFHKLRWFLWRCIYLKIIRIVNFESCLLSRIHNYGKPKVVMFLLLLLLLFLLWHVIPQIPLPLDSLSQVFYSIISSVLYISSFFTSVFSYFVQKCPEFTYPTWFVKTEESASLITESNYESKEPIYHQKEESNIIQPNTEIKVLYDEINSLKIFLKDSIKETEVSKFEKESELQNEIKNLQLEFQSLSKTVGGLEMDIKKQSEKSGTKEDIIALTNKYKNHIDHLKLRLTTIEEKLSVLEGLKKCCDKQWKEEDFSALIDKHLILAFKNVVNGDSDPKSKYSFFNSWLKDFALRRKATESDNEMNYDKVKKVVEGTVLKYVDSIKRNLSDLNKSSYSKLDIDLFSEDRIKQIVKEAIMLYDADKIGQVDYALESGGGSVLGTRCSETYVEKYGKLSIFGVPLWTNSNSPRTAIQPEVQPGRCWAFKGSQGFLVIELSATISPTGFTLEHIPVSLSPSGSIDSAPKNFSIWGLDSEKDSKGNLLGEYWYDINGEPLQYFAVQKPSDKPYTYVELQIHSNHGNMEYTCLYRFRVHGNRVR